VVGVPNGVQRFLGKSFAENLLNDAKVFVKASILLVSIGIACSSILLLFLGEWIFSNYDIDFFLIIFAILLVATTCLSNLFRGIIISSLNTRILLITNIVSGGVKIGLGVTLILIGTEVIGVMIGFTSFTILSSILLGINVIMIFRSSEKKSEIKLKGSIKNIFSASVVNWIPELIRMPGIHLGTIVMFGVQGAGLAGVYFIAFSVFNAMLVIISVLLTIGFPIISGMQSGRKKLVWRLTKISLVFGLPISSIIMFFADHILLVFGKAYSDDGSFTLVILSFSILPIIVSLGVRNLVYAYGNYRQVLAIGLGVNLPRIVLYFTLIPLYGASGAALSFTIGSVIGLIVSIVIAKKVGLKIFGKDLGIIFAIPTGLGYLLSYYEINFAVSITLILVISYFAYLRIGIIKRDDLDDSISILPKKIAVPTLKILKKFVR